MKIADMRPPRFRAPREARRGSSMVPKRSRSLTRRGGTPSGRRSSYIIERVKIPDIIVVECNVHWNPFLIITPPPLPRGAGGTYDASVVPENRNAFVYGNRSQSSGGCYGGKGVRRRSTHYQGEQPSKRMQFPYSASNSCRTRK